MALPKVRTGDKFENLRTCFNTIVLNQKEQSVLNERAGEELEKARREIRSHTKLISDLRKERAELLKQSEIERSKFEKIAFDLKTTAAMATSLHGRVEASESSLKSLQEEKAALKADVEIWQDEQRRSRANAEEMSATISNLKAALEDERTTKTRLEADLSRQCAQQASVAALLETAQHERRNLSCKLAEAERTNATLQEELAHNKDIIVQTEGALLVEKKDRDAADHQITTLTSSVINLTQRLQGLELERATLLSQLQEASASIQQHVKTAAEATAKYEADLVAQNDTLATLEARFAAQKARDVEEVNRVKAELATALEGLTAATKKIAVIKIKKHQKATELTAIQQMLAQVQAENEDLKHNATRLQELQDELRLEGREAVAAAQKEAEEKGHQLAALERKLEALQTQMQVVEDKAATVASDLSTANAALQETKTTLDRVEKSYSTAKELAAQKEKESDQLRATVATLEQAAVKYKSDLEAKEKSADVYLRGYQELLDKGKERRITAELARARETIEKFESGVSATKGSDELRRRLQLKEDEIERVTREHRQQMQEIEKAMAETTEQLNFAKQRVTELEQQLNDARIHLAKTERKLRRSRSLSLSPHKQAHSHAHQTKLATPPRPDTPAVGTQRKRVKVSGEHATEPASKQASQTVVQPPVTPARRPFAAARVVVTTDSESEMSSRPARTPARQDVRQTMPSGLDTPRLRHSTDGSQVGPAARGKRPYEAAAAAAGAVMPPPTPKTPAHTPARTPTATAQAARPRAPSTPAGKAVMTSGKRKNSSRRVEPDEWFSTDVFGFDE